ncbi:AraC family transcriptional regulator [Planotetraspora kaengkrachanensis]|uniref:AraC family transcriptional regulator n=1 Tax=Planotetraspora kaengkrachanensis TaxID=575193 RepID=A0A8J3PTS0_9ACTN|nr:AraC family transcriptional regulator [Planotetraspora kaengkrachanensis]GIG80884.1 AraC family transcriptional regulator [Planotetraspora kaengkrachanensis]
MDWISEIVRLARPQAVLDKRCLFAGATTMDVPAYGTGKAAFHVLLDGVCTIEAPGRHIPLTAGDVVLLPGGQAHHVRTAGAGGRGAVEEPGDTFSIMRSPSGGEIVMDLLCGHYAFGSGAGAMLFRSLPDPLHVSFGQADEIVRMLSTLMRREARHDGLGTGAILSCLCNALLAMVLRTSPSRYVGTPAWTAADDPRLRLVIEAVLRDPGGDWTVPRLAEVAAMSRATLARNFSRSTGLTPGEFVTQVRMMIAAERLVETDLTVAAVAAGVGYDSESAFNRAFRQATGTTPARFRRALQRSS